MLVYSDELLTANEADPSLLRHDRICWDTLTRGIPVTVSSAATGFGASALRNGLTYTKWKPETLPATADIGNASRVNCDYFAIAGHTLGSTSTTVTFQAADLDDLGQIVNVRDLGSHSPEDDSPIIFLFTETEPSDVYRLKLEGGSPEPSIAVLYVGESLVMERSVNFGFRPPELNRETRVKPLKTVSGAFAGRSVEIIGNVTKPSWANLSNDWYRRYFDPFAEASQQYAFFAAFLPTPGLAVQSLSLDFVNNEYASRPYALQRDGGVIYGWTPDGMTVNPAHNGVRNLINVSMDIEGLANG